MTIRHRVGVLLRARVRRWRVLWHLYRRTSRRLREEFVADTKCVGIVPGRDKKRRTA